MSRLLLTAVMWHLALSFSAAQDARLFNQVVASTGTVAVQQGITYTYTVGEVVIPTLKSGDFTLTQGFHQPEHTSIVLVNEPSLAEWNIEVFPNPATERFTITYAGDKGDGLRVSVFDLLGKLIISQQVLDEPEGSVLDCSTWQPGVYFLQLQDTKSHASATVRVIRI